MVKTNIRFNRAKEFLDERGILIDFIHSENTKELSRRDTIISFISEDPEDDRIIRKNEYERFEQNFRDAMIKLVNQIVSLEIEADKKEGLINSIKGMEAYFHLFGAELFTLYDIEKNARLGLAKFIEINIEGLGRRSTIEGRIKDSFLSYREHKESNGEKIKNIAETLFEYIVSVKEWFDYYKENDDEYMLNKLFFLKFSDEAGLNSFIKTITEGFTSYKEYKQHNQHDSFPGFVREVTRGSRSDKLKHKA